MSNRTVTYIDMGLNSVSEYWARLLIPAVHDFRTRPDSRYAFQASHTVWHLHDWAWHEANPGKDSRGPDWELYRHNLLRRCPQLGWLRDVADAGKHRGLGRQPEVAKAGPVVTGGVAALRLRIARGGRLRFVLVLNDGSHEDLLVVLETATRFWRAELPDLALPDPFAPLAPKPTAS